MIIVTKTVAKLTVRSATAGSICLLTLWCASAIVAQQPPPPRGVPPPLPNTPDTERNWERINARSSKKYDARAPTGKPVLGDIRKDFNELQAVANNLHFSLASQGTLNHKYIGDAASRIRTLAIRLNANLALGKPQVEAAPPDPEYSDEILRTSLVSLHRLVARFVDNPIFRERGILDIPQTKRAKQDVDGIVAVSEQIKRLTRRGLKLSSR